MSNFEWVPNEILWHFPTSLCPTTSPSPLRIFWVQKITHKKLLNFSEKVHWQFKTILHLSPKHLKRHYPSKNTPIFWFKRGGKVLISENTHFLVIFSYFQISLAISSSGVESTSKWIWHILTKHSVSKGFLKVFVYFTDMFNVSKRLL